MKTPDAVSSDDNAIKDALHEALEDNDGLRLSRIMEDVGPQDALRHFSHLPESDRDRLVSIVDPKAAAALLEDAPSELAGQAFEDVEPERAAQIMQSLDTDTQADILQQLDEDDADSILSKMEHVQAESLRELSSYSPDSAGGLMVTHVFSMNANDTVGSALSKLAHSDEDMEKYHDQHLYVHDDNGHLIGVASIRALITAKRVRKLTDIMSSLQTVSIETPLDTLIELFEEHAFLSIPVVDSAGTTKGVVLRTAVMESQLKRAEHDGLSRQRMSEELRSLPTALRAKRRLAWLSSNIVLNIIAASVISMYEETLAAVIAIAIFLPMVSDMSGCSGNQAVGVSMRELSLGLAKPADVFRVLRKEISVGVINGIILGILIGTVAWIWKGNVALGAVIGSALALNTVLAVCIGGTIPLILKRFGIDPAVASGPLLTTVTDMAGFFLVLSLATLAMPYLIA